MLWGINILGLVSLAGLFVLDRLGHRVEREFAAFLDRKFGQDSQQKLIFAVGAAFYGALEAGGRKFLTEIKDGFHAQDTTEAVVVFRDTLLNFLKDIDKLAIFGTDIDEEILTELNNNTSRSAKNVATATRLWYAENFDKVETELNRVEKATDNK